MNRKVSLIMVSASIVITMVACSFGSILPSATDEPVQDPINNPPPAAGALEILSTSITTDTYGSVYLFGEVLNTSSTAIGSIQLTVEVTDASGASLITDIDGNVLASDTVYPMLYTLGAGESSPFVYYLGTPASAPASHNVTVLTYSEVEANRATMEYQNVEIVEDGYGNYYLSGELLNTSDQWVRINSLAGGVLDDANNVLSADWTGTYTASVAPSGDPDLRDRTPFAVDFTIPTQEVTQWSIWWDADIDPNATDYDLGVNVTNTYFDEYGSAHIVGYVENYTDQPLTTIVVGGLYDPDGAVLDAGYSFLATASMPGGATPFEISYFGSVNYISDQAARVDTYSAQFDPWSTYTPYYSTVELTYSGETVEKNGASWIVSGTFTNSSTSNLAGATVMVSVFSSDGNLVGYGYSYAYPEGESFAPGDTGTYEVYLYLDSYYDLATIYTETVVVGDISE